MALQAMKRKPFSFRLSSPGDGEPSGAVCHLGQLAVFEPLGVQWGDSKTNKTTTKPHTHILEMFETHLVLSVLSTNTD